MAHWLQVPLSDTRSEKSLKSILKIKENKFANLDNGNFLISVHDVALAVMKRKLAKFYIPFCGYVHGRPQDYRVSISDGKPKPGRQ